jgi:uncharacterized cupredoxin-like copper-binding protein
MTKRTTLMTATALILALSLAAGLGLSGSGRAHEGHHHDAFSAGEPGDPKKPARTVRVLMIDYGSEKEMKYELASITVRKGEQIRFVLENGGTESHEFMLATVAENRKHGELMKKFPDMEHDDPNAKRLTVGQKGELVWKFTNAGEFEFACLIPGHYEAGMHGKIIVK